MWPTTQKKKQRMQREMQVETQEEEEENKEERRKPKHTKENKETKSDVVYGKTLNSWKLPHEEEVNKHHNIQ